MAGTKRGRAGRVRRAARKTRTSSAATGAPGRLSVRSALRRGNRRRSEQRTARRRAIQQIAQSLQATPRPVVRPAGAPRRVLPRRPSPVAARVPMARRGVRPTARSRPLTRRPDASKGTQFGKALAGATAATAIGALVINAASAHPDLAEEAGAFQRDLSALRDQASFERLQSDISQIDVTLEHVVELLESARDEGYRFQRDLDAFVYQLVSEWQTVRQQLDRDLQEQKQVFQSRLPPLIDSVRQVNASLSRPKVAAPLLQNTHTAVNDLLNDAQQIQSDLQRRYTGIRTKAFQANNRLTQIHWALDQLGESRFDLSRDEDLVMGVPARWDQQGDEDPEGVLYVTSQRLIFEQKEKVATKKVLFLTLASELAHEVMIGEPLSNVRSVKSTNRGLFGHQDFLEVSFDSPKLKTVAFHLNGQDSEEWARLVHMAKSGEIEKDRASGSRIAFTELTGPLTASSIVGLQTEINELQDEMMLKGVQAELEELENGLRALERKLSEIRARGYAFERNLEADLAVLSSQWARVRANAERTLAHQTRLLADQFIDVQQMVAEVVAMSADLSAARPLYMRTRSAMASAEAQADAAEDTVLTQFDQYADEIEALDAHLEWVGWMLDALATASFRLIATEGGIAATEALWERPNADAENGVLFLTDQRLLWEDRVGDYELKVEIPVQQIQNVQAEAVNGSEAESLIFTFDSEAPLREARFQLESPVTQAWLKMLGRARSGDYGIDRAVPVDSAELERVRNAPSQCPNCGAAITAPILRGQNSVQCEYCSVEIRL